MKSNSFSSKDNHPAIRQDSLRIVVNGDPLELPAGTTVQQLLEVLEIRAVLVAVEQNRQIVPKAEFSSRKLSDGDQIEIVHFVGGG